MQIGLDSISAWRIGGLYVLLCLPLFLPQLGSLSLIITYSSAPWVTIPKAGSNPTGLVLLVLSRDETEGIKDSLPRCSHPDFQRQLGCPLFLTLRTANNSNSITWFIVLTHLQQICSCICISLPTVQLPFWFHCMLGWCVWIMSWTQLPSGYHPGVQIEWAPCSMHHPLNPWGEQHGHVLFMLLKFNRWTYPMHISSLP
jgi:hypothetical protein